MIISHTYVCNSFFLMIGIPIIQIPLSCILCKSRSNAIDLRDLRSPLGGRICEGVAKKNRALASTTLVWISWKLVHPLSPTALKGGFRGASPLSSRAWVLRSASDFVPTRSRLAYILGIEFIF